MGDARLVGYKLEALYDFGGTTCTEMSGKADFSTPAKVTCTRISTGTGLVACKEMSEPAVTCLTFIAAVDVHLQTGRYLGPKREPD